jgi:hypothetical protein
MSREAESYACLDQDSAPPVTYGMALVKLLKEPLIHMRGASILPVTSLLSSILLLRCGIVS